MFLTKIIEDIPVVCVAKKGHPAHVAGKAFYELEQKVPLKGNKFYGIFDENSSEYRACVELNETNLNLITDLSRGIIKGGSYAYTTLAGNYNTIIRQISSAFDSLAAEYQRDPSRLCVEFYKRHTEIIVMLPIKQ